MTGQRKNLFTKVIYVDGAEFSERNFRERSQQILAEYRALFPALLSIHDGYLDCRYSVKNETVTLHIDLLLSPQERLAFQHGRKTVSITSQTLLDELARQIIDSSRSTQQSIYSEAYLTNAGDGSAGSDHRALHKWMNRYRRQEYVVETTSGQVRFNFPDYCDQILTEEVFEISGLIGSVKCAAIELLVIRPGKAWPAGLKKPASNHRKWIFLPRCQDSKPITMAAHQASYRDVPLRIVIKVRASMDALSHRVHYFVAEDTEGLAADLACDVPPKLSSA